MKAFKKLMIAMLACACIGTTAIGFASCTDDEDEEGTKTEQSGGGIFGNKNSSSKKPIGGGNSSSNSGSTSGSSDSTSGSSDCLIESSGSGSDSNGSSSDDSSSSSIMENKCVVTYSANGGYFTNGADSRTVSVDEYTILRTPESPKRAGYTFAGWSTSLEEALYWDFANEVVYSDVTLYAMWREEKAKILNVDNADIFGDSIRMIVDAGTDSVALADKVVCDENSTWKLYSDKLGQTEIPTRIAVGSNGTLAGGSNIFYIVVTSGDGTQVNTYELDVYRSFQVSIAYYSNYDYYYGGSNLLETDYAYTGYEYTATYVPSITGYTFNYWYDAYSYSSSRFTSEILWESKTLVANKTANTYTVTYNAMDGTTVDATEEVTYDSSYYFEVPTREGYDFMGWYYKDYFDDKIYVSDTDGYCSRWSYADDVELFAEWELREIEVDLEYNDYTISAGTVTGASGEWNDNTYEYNTYYYGDDVTISATTYLGYKWLGWYDKYTEELISENAEYTFTAEEDVTYVAKWEVEAEVANLTFNSDTSYFQITGVKDKNLTSLVIPEYTTAINSYAFQDWYNLATIEYNATELSNFSSYNYIFNNAGSNVDEGITLTIGANVKRIPAYMFNPYSDYTSYAPNITSVVFEGNSVCEEIGNYAFAYCGALTTVTLPASLETLGGYSFSYCSSLAEIVVPDSVTAMGEYAFAYSGVQRATIGDGLETIANSAFRNCTNLSYVDFGENVQTIGSYAFYNATSLYGVVLNGNISSINSNSFYYCSNLTYVVIGSSVSSIGGSAFYNCSNITAVYYEGASSDWSNIYISSSNGSLTNADRYYNGQWYYNEYGVPTVNA